MPRFVTGAAVLTAALVAAAPLAAGPASAATPAAASAGVAATSVPSELALVGHGYGHGRGMGQYGAYGYALTGWNVNQILNQYYGGTAASAVSTAQTIDVRLDELDNASTITAQGATAYVGGAQVATGPVTVTRVNGSQLSVNGAPAQSGDVTLVPSGAGPIVLAIPGGTRAYKGNIVVKAAPIGGYAQVWNTVGIEDYVAGVVPAESPASWGTNGPAALQAQAVAARSYALSYVRAAGGPICDTTYCQVYDGDQDAAGNPTNSAYTTYSDAAVQATAGVVRTCTAAACGTPGQVAFTEFSSSTGGWTAGGAFSAAVDDGDGVAQAGNPNHDWSQTVPASSIEAAWPSIGTFESITVTARNGLGDLGGRVKSLVVSGTAGSVTVSGDSFAANLGLRSDWFAPTNVGRPSGGLDGYWLLGSDGGVYPFGGAVNYGSTKGAALNAPVLAMAPTADQAGYWLVAADGGIFQFGDARFYGSTGNVHLNRPVIGMTATADSAGYWLFAGDGGVFQFGDAGFYGSTGNVHLNQPIVGMAPTPDGKGYWLVASDGGIFDFGDAGFYGSTGNVHLNQPVVGMVPTADGKGYTLVARDGGIFQFGDAKYYGSLPGIGVSDTVVAVAPTADGGGYLILGAGGTVYPFGDAPSYGNGNSAPGWPGRALDIFGHKG
ncbi:hypothetical protein K6U06_14375 [Acidiferrimicrobium sp. IK]|uniref:SpoIID/LytB domain-containing protein n=1 Tax=Acidiferrimicrobium sp. IK TaxID=2871700 RepID=UPI0021CB46B3|nr:SpoIID/LytB domain-containing protein [Acidiferrimicrobium sp. IK]MCU4185551.1 hypothetical protein [Acidiferrimicrobium sp. IK]